MYYLTIQLLQSNVNNFLCVVEKRYSISRIELLIIAQERHNALSISCLVSYFTQLWKCLLRRHYPPHKLKRAGNDA